MDTAVCDEDREGSLAENADGKAAQPHPVDIDKLAIGDVYPHLAATTYARDPDVPYGGHSDRGIAGGRESQGRGVVREVEGQRPLPIGPDARQGETVR